MQILKSGIPFLIAAQFALPVCAQTADSLRAELDLVVTQIEEADATIARFDGGLIRALAEARKEALSLSEAVIRNRILGLEGGNAVEIVIPAVQPDDARATRILGEISAAQSRIAEAEKEAARAGGLIQAVALSRVETEKLTLAQLQMGYFQAKYGIAFPNSVALAPPPSSGSGSGEPEPLSTAQDTATGEAETLPWADKRFPQIDYSLQPFEQAHKDGDRISGWWSIETERAVVDDSPKVVAINYSNFEPGSYSGFTGLLARCTEGETALVYIQDDYLMTDFRRNSFDVTYRIDDAPAQQTRWNSLTNNKGAGLFGREAEQFLRRIYDAKSLFIRLVEKNGQRHDAVFDLSGGQDAVEAVASACGWSTLSLSPEDYKAIQTMLNAGGFEAGTPDGRWGAGSKRALKAFQASVGLPETGAPDRATLTRLGFGE